jgi:hypothetical protein
VHVNDLADLYVLLIEAAIAGNTDAELWGAKGYIFPDGGEHVWGDLSRSMGQKAVELGYLKEAKEKSLEKDAAIEQAGTREVRARERARFLGGSPQGLLLRRRCRRFSRRSTRGCRNKFGS